ncbi:hypothetical protein [Planctopirus hydrillae]|uniref:hypothetical protein n=1 Tax=Planctopirus hydrillae TaxID=1841610 RepID=UPI001041D43B|nr:hypothetical protein [Planctopirus hydrillae]
MWHHPHIRRRNTAHGSALGKTPESNNTEVVERTISWLAGRGRFHVRYDRHQQIIPPDPRSPLF